MHGSDARQLVVRSGQNARAVVVSLWDRNALVDASAMAFSLFLASIPLMGLVGVVIAHVLRGEPQALGLISSALDVAPSDVRQIVDRHIARGTDQRIAPMFLGGSLWIAATAFQDAMTVFESALGAPRRSWLRKRVIALTWVVGLLTLLGTIGWAFVSFVGGPLALLGTVVERGQEAAPWVVTPVIGCGMVWLLVAAFFRIAVRHPHSKPAIWPGATATVVMGTFASYAFARYAQSLASYAVLYGSLAAVAVFLIWLWLCCIALLVGVEVNAFVERSRAAVARAAAYEAS